MNYFDRGEETVSKATEWAEKALELVPNLPEAYRALGRIMQTTGRPKEAASYYMKAVTYKEDYYQAYRSLGWLAKDSFKYGEALRWIRKSLSINSTDLETIFLKGVLHFERKESKQAVNDFTRCLELRPDYGRAHFFMGLVYMQLGRVPDAIESMIKAVDYGGDINAPYMLGYIYMCDAAFVKSINYLQKAVQYKEIAFAARYFLGIVCLLTEQSDIAAACFDAVIDQCRDLLAKQSDFISARSVLAQALALRGDIEDCREEIKALEPHVDADGSIAQDIARAYAIMGDSETARRYIGIAVDTHQGPTQAEINLDPILKRFLAE
jgi:tetratricopeptide (TPR) repeat protein